MSTIQGFAKQLAELPGLAEFALVRSDGNLAAHKAKNPETLGSMAALVGISCASLRNQAGFSHLRHVTIARADNQHTFIFPTAKYFVAATKKSSVQSSAFTERILELLAETAGDL